MQDDREPVFVTLPYLPDRKNLDEYIDRIYQSKRVTNNGPLVQELTKRLEQHLGVSNLLLVANGTLALQIAYKTLGITGKAITTPFTFAATASSLKWERIEPVFADIEEDTFCIDPVQVQRLALGVQGVSAIVPVHVFGNACDTEAIEKIAVRHDIKVIYDAAHAFGVRYKGKSLLAYGDASILSFHATKIFHTIEGGAIVFKQTEDYEKAKQLINFGFNSNGEIVDVGINAKMNEFEAAIGLCVLDEIEEIVESRKSVFKRYINVLNGSCRFQVWRSENSNYGYCPIVLDSEEVLYDVLEALNDICIFPRRYFYPSLSTIQDIETSRTPCEFAEMIARRILCLPIYYGLKNRDIDTVARRIMERV